MKLREVLKNPHLRGVAIGGCIEDARPVAVTAHAHFEANRYHGWICIADMADLNSTTVIHELAHVVRRNANHDEAWRKAVRKLGGRVERRYL